MNQYIKIFLLATLFILSGCLQEPAVIEGTGNYYIDRPQKSAINRHQYINKNRDDLDENYIFEDEKQIVNSNKSTFDPYQDNYSSNKNSKEDLEFKNDDELEVKKPDNKNNNDIDWNNIFQETKNEQKKELNNKTKNEINSKTQSNNLKNNKEEIKIIKKDNPNQKTQDKEIDNTNKNKSSEKTTNQGIKNNGESKLCCIKKPTNGPVLSKYGKSNDNEFDDGMTFKVTDKNVLSSGNGKVIYVDGENSSRKTIIVKHDNGLISSYSYNGTINTGLNREVKAGQIIGAVNEEKNILYFTVRNSGKTLNPETIMR